MKRWQKNLLKYGIAGAVGGGMALAVLELHGFSTASEPLERYRILADAFTIPGMILLLVGVLVMVSNEGMFEGLSYVMTYAVRMLIPGLHKDQERYADYVERKREKGPMKGFGFLFVTGGIFMVFAAVFIALFYSLY